MQRPAHNRIEEIELYLDGSHPNREAFELEMQQDATLAAEVQLHRDLAQAFSNDSKNRLRSLLHEVAQDHQMAATHSIGGGALVRHIDHYRKYYMAAAAAFALVLCSVWFLRQPTDDSPLAHIPATPTVPTEQPTATPTPSEEPAAVVSAPEKNTSASNGKPKKPVELRNVEMPSSIELGSDGIGTFSIYANVFENNSQTGEKLVLRLVPKSDANAPAAIDETVKTEKNTAYGFAQKDAPQRILEWQDAVQAAPGKYRLLVLLPDGRVVYSNDIELTQKKL
ncbi:MAG: hypothetical protein ACK4Q5_02690 [Saprospiraceae bacterium]